MASIHGAAPEHEHPVKAFGWAARDETGILSPFTFSRRATGENDVTFKVLYCGICHSDLHEVQNDWKDAMYPMVPGHEIVGEVTEVGCGVTKFKVGDKVGVGTLVGSCSSCETCGIGFPNYCTKMISTYNAIYHDGSVTYGGYSDIMTADQRFVVGIPENLPLDGVAPLLCAGATVYSPMKYYGLDKPGLHLGVAGLGGLGHIAVKFAKALGMKVTVIDIFPDKKQYALDKLGADAFINSRDESAMQAAVGTMHGLIDTVPVPHNLEPFLNLLKTFGKLVMVCIPDKPVELPPFPLLKGRKIVGGSLMGGPHEVQEMIDLASKHNITADVEVVKMDYVNTAMKRLAKGDVRFRFVIDIGNSLKATQI